MKKFIAVIVLQSFCLFQASQGCTTFFLEKNGKMVFGRNYDWVTGTGVVHTNLRGLSKTSFRMDNGNTITWVSQYGSTTFNQYGKEFPTGGMNEKGLVVELMWLNETKYPAADNRPGVNVLQWIQYQLDNCSTVGEVLATDKKIRIVSSGTPQHYLVADSNGDVATIEFLDGKMVVHTGKDLPFSGLANSTYEASANSMKSLLAPKNKNARSFSDNSISRFTKACSMVNEYREKDIKKSLVDYSFDILSEVSQGSFTKWSVVYDISNRTIYFKTERFPVVKFFKTSAFDFSCSSQPAALNMNQELKGDVTGNFKKFSAEENGKTVRSAFFESREHIRLADPVINLSVNYPLTPKCVLP